MEQIMRHAFSDDPELKRYMGNVCGVAALGLASAGVGAKMHLDQHLHAGFLWTIAQIVLSLILFTTTENSGKNFRMDRFGLFLAFGFCCGVNVGSWIEYGVRTAGYGVISMDNQLIYDAFGLTTLVFAIFTIAGLAATSAVISLVAFAIMIGTTIMFWTSIAALFGFVGLLAHDVVFIRMGLVVMSAYVVFDSWVIKKEAARGKRDVLTHAMVLLSDYLQLFIRIVVLLAQKKEKAKK